MSTPSRFRTHAAAAIISLTIAGCTTAGPGGPGPGNGASTCNEAVVGAIAAAICGAVTSGNNRLRTAAACGAAAAFGCYVFNSYQADQTRSTQEVSDEYIKAKGALPDTPVVKTYTTTLIPQTSVRQGGKLTMASDIEVVPGRNSNAVSIQEELVIKDSVGDIWAGPQRKQANGRTNAAGRYSTTFDLPISNDMQRGRYTYEKTLYVDGRAVVARKTSGAFDVVAAAGDRKLSVAR